MPFVWKSIDPRGILELVKCSYKLDLLQIILIYLVITWRYVWVVTTTNLETSSL